jgi:cellulose synthase operon protein C
MEKTLAKVEKLEPDSIDVLVMRAAMLTTQGRTVDAEKILLKARDKNSKQIQPHTALVVLAEREKDWPKAERLVAEAARAMGDCVEVRLLQSQYLVQRRPDDVVPRLRKLLENADQFPEASRLQLWAGLLSAALQVGDMEQAGSLAQKIAQKQPNNALVRYFLFEKAIAAGDIPATKKALKEIEVVAGQDSYWLYGQAVLLCLQTKDRKDVGPLMEQALNYLNRAGDLRKDWSRIPMVKAGIYLVQGKTDLALRSFQEAFDLGERNPAAIERMLQIYLQSQRIMEADQLLRRLEGERPSLPSAWLKMEAEIAQQLGDTDRAVDRARKAVSPDSKSYSDQLWLGQMLAVFGMQAKEKEQAADAAVLLGDAEKAFRQAVKLEPKLPKVWVSLVAFLAAVGQQDKAETTIQEAETNIPAKDAPLALGRCYEIVKKPDDAQKQYEDALKAAPQDVLVARTLADFYRRVGKPLTAKELLQKILDGKYQAKEPDLAWARRELARVLAGSGRYPDLLKAESLVEQNLSGPGAVVADLRLLATLKESDPRPAEWDRAIVLLERLGQSVTPDDRFTLAKLRSKKGDWIKASGLLRGLVASSAKDTRYLEFYIKALIDHNELSSAEGYCDHLDEIAPNSFITVSRRADLLCAKNQPRQAIELLKNFVDNVDAQPQSRGLRLRLAAGKVIELGRQWTKPESASVVAEGMSLAESLLRTYVKENPGHELVLAVFLGQHGKVGEALDMLEESLQIANVGEFSEACTCIVQAGKCSKEQMQRMSKIMQSAEVKFERPAPLLMALAALRTYQTLYSEAVGIYREILQKTPDDPAALNNLAVVQALQGVKLDESLKLVNQAMERAGPLGAMLDSRATVYLAMKDPEKALADMNASIANKEEETPVRLFHLAQAHLLAGDSAQAKQVMVKALKMGLAKEMLQPLEFPAFEKLRQLSR